LNNGRGKSISTKPLSTTKLGQKLSWGNEAMRKHRRIVMRALRKNKSWVLEGCPRYCERGAQELLHRTVLLSVV
jgi:hypothetical protein